MVRIDLAYIVLVKDNYNKVIEFTWHSSRIVFFAHDSNSQHPISSLLAETILHIQNIQSLVNNICMFFIPDGDVNPKVIRTRSSYLAAQSELAVRILQHSWMFYYFDLLTF